jgi:predicted deacylase
VHQTWDLTREPEVVHYQADGILYGRRQPGRVKPGNCCLVVATPYNAPL